MGGFIGVLDLSATDSADTGIPWTASVAPTGATPAQLAAVLDATPEVAGAGTPSRPPKGR
jgi:hypothetical protein